MTKNRREAIERLERQVGSIRRHRCPKYVNARGEVIDPAQQSGIGCHVCQPTK